LTHPSERALLGKREYERRRDLDKACRSLFWLATNILGYDRLTKGFHKPMMDEMDSQRRRGVTRCMELWPRGHYKTTIRIAQMVQDLLIDHNDTIFVVHAVEDEVQNIVEECGTFFQQNKELRRLIPDCRPSTTDRRFLKQLQFTLKRSKYSRQASVRGKSVNTEITGAHVNKLYLDDIVGRKTIEDSGLPKVKSWIRSTALPVLNPGGCIRVTGTRWDTGDPYGTWLEAKGWECRVRAATETDGKPDYAGVPVLFTAAELRSRRLEMGESDYAFQMMNDPSPSGDKPWSAKKCEHYVELAPNKDQALPGSAGPGFVAVLSDPAPATIGSHSGEKEKQRGDGRKDEWTLAAVKFKSFNGLQVAILLEVIGSREWTRSLGLDAACRLMQKWGTNKFFNEAYGGLAADYTEDMKKACRRNGVSLYLAKDGALPKYKNSYAKGAKNLRFAALADWAGSGRFYICKSTMSENDLELFLSQARGWLPLPSGKNTLPYDDRADVVARLTDPALQEFAPQPAAPMPFNFDPDWEEGEEPIYRSRYTLG
jgi:hypothetical protein